MNGNDKWMVEVGSGFCLPAKALQMCFGRPGAQADYFKRDGAIKTFLIGAINYPLTATANFLQQFVIAKVSQHFNVRHTVTPARHGFLIGRVFILAVEQTKTGLKKASRADFSCYVTVDCCSAPSANSRGSLHSDGQTIGRLFS